MRVPYRGPDALSCVRHYTATRQSGSGVPGVFTGGRGQRGHGFLGNVFGGLLRGAVPFIKKGLAGIGRYALKSGGGVLSTIWKRVKV